MTIDAAAERLQTDDGHTIPLNVWLPDGQPEGVIQIVHGLGEHGARYVRFAKVANERGYAVYAQDLRGHGPEAETPGHFADAEGWDKITADVTFVHDKLVERHSIPVVMLGHSMGSFIAQTFASNYGGRLAGLILSGSTLPSAVTAGVAGLIGRFESMRHGARGNSRLLHWLGFGRFNAPFKPNRTELDWLSRDDAEVDKYVADPLCGGPYSVQTWRDLTYGLQNLAKRLTVMRIPGDLPILIAGGEKDPVGGDSGLSALMMRYAETGHQRLKLKLYEDGRHEILNDTNREEVTQDLLDWIDEQTRQRRQAA